MPLEIATPQTEINSIVTFLQTVMQRSGKSKIVVAVSGGIDSALSLTLAVKAVGAAQVFPILLPYKDQSIEDSRAVVAWNAIPEANTSIINIEKMVDAAVEQLQASGDQMRVGNIMARTRMIAVYDLAKKIDALVCGTENKSEKHLGYFTRFGDEASDIEPLQHLYKTQVRQLVEFMKLPPVFLEKAPSAGLWQGQTDEAELGFSYEDADKALSEIIDGEVAGAPFDVKVAVQLRVKNQRFKHEVPYTL